MDNRLRLLRRIPPAASQETGEPVFGLVSCQSSWPINITLGEGPVHDYDSAQ